MTVKERIRQLVEELPNELPETAATAAETVLGPYREPAAPGARARTLTMEERRAAVDAAQGCMRNAPGSVDDFLRRKHEDTRLEEERSARRRVPVSKSSEG